MYRRSNTGLAALTRKHYPSEQLAANTPSSARLGVWGDLNQVECYFFFYKIIADIVKVMM